MPRIYLVDDEPVVRDALQRVLSELAVQVVVFDDAALAWEAIQRDMPALLVTDIRLPGMTGLELCQKVREHHSRLDLPVMVVSAADEFDDLSRAYEVGADDYLVKPVAADELRAKARLLLQRASHRQSEAETWQRYEILGKLGKGQTGATTFHARRKGDGVELALKVVEERAGAVATASLLAEAELLRALGEVPGLVRVRDMGTDGGCTYYAMDLVPGATLRERLDAETQLAADEVARIGRALAVTLASLAEVGVTHGDLKPSNVILGPDGPVLIDFGLARRVGVGADAPDDRGGTLTYLAPEVVRGEPASSRSDVYSLGVMLFEALAGRLPYAASGSDLAAQKVEGLAADLAPLLDLGAAPGLVAVIESALEADCQDRSSQPGELALALLPYAS